MPLWPQEERVRSPSLHSPGLPDYNSELAGAQAPPRCAVARPHVPATRTGPSPAHTLVPPLSSPRCPAGTPEHNSKGKNFFRGGGKSCSPQDVTSQARQCVSLLSYKQRNLTFHLGQDQPAELNWQQTDQRRRQQLQAGIWVFFTLPCSQRPEGSALESASPKVGP